MIEVAADFTCGQDEPVDASGLGDIALNPAGLHVDTVDPRSIDDIACDNAGSSGREYQCVVTGQAGKGSAGAAVADRNTVFVLSAKVACAFSMGRSDDQYEERQDFVGVAQRNDAVAHDCSPDQVVRERQLRVSDARLPRESRRNRDLATADMPACSRPAASSQEGIANGVKIMTDRRQLFVAVS
ncbi:Unknown protein sequence [Pseudomonas syringae pv. cilantro]|uniref:Uncharacterized protein n=1 Tax=Pseudomonas syringae pv. cilantro TaxID=81035 RepID=A0A0N1JMY0_PSESX|nr:Unknown protein sequence [Pseudomonas syringae pv. cilantro]